MLNWAESTAHLHSAFAQILTKKCKDSELELVDLVLCPSEDGDLSTLPCKLAITQGLAKSLASVSTALNALNLFNWGLHSCSTDSDGVKLRIHEVATNCFVKGLLPECSFERVTSEMLSLPLHVAAL